MSQKHHSQIETGGTDSRDGTASINFYALILTKNAFGSGCLSFFYIRLPK